MRVLPINNYSNNQNKNFKGVNKFCKYSIRTLIASSTLFMLSNAVDTFKPEKVSNDSIGFVNTIASVLGIAGTALGIFGIEKEEDHSSK